MCQVKVCMGGSLFAMAWGGGTEDAAEEVLAVSLAPQPPALIAGIPKGHKHPQTP